LSYRGNNGSAAGSGSAAHTGSNKNHIASGKNFSKFFPVFFERFFTNIRVSACTKPAGYRSSYLYLMSCAAAVQYLSISVYSHVFNTDKPAFYHTFYCITSTAANSYYSGNKALAQSDLERMVVRYGDTSAGVQGAMLLAQILYEGGKWPEGIAKLEAAAARSSGRRFSAALQGLIATGFADQQKYDDAAKHYLRASDEAPFPADKDLYRADAARILMLAGKQDDARKIWAALASKLDSPVLGEAKIRLGELSVVPPAKN